MKKQLSLWLVSFYAEFIALLLNSFLGLLFWPSLKGGGEGLWPFPATLTVVSWFSVSLGAGGGRGDAPACESLAPANFLGKLLVACLLGLFRGLRPSFAVYFIRNGTFKPLSSQITRRTRRRDLNSHQPASQSNYHWARGSVLLLQFYFLIINFWCSRTFWLLTN
jgi:hypothetical protein